jgi:hypothetical protein
MKTYIGATAAQKGAEFAEQIACLLRSRGWQCRTELDLTALGGTADQGDIDVLAWRDGGPVYVIECKRLQPVKTIGEIANLFEKFLGDEDELLHKHLRRVSWLQANPDRLVRVIGQQVGSQLIQQRLITNARVPMAFAKRLPVPASTMLSIEDLESGIPEAGEPSPSMQ